MAAPDTPPASLAVIEKTGPVEEVAIYRSHAMGQVVGSHIDLRLFLRHWRYGFALGEPARSGLRESLQFFDGHGVAVHKIYRVDGTDAAAYAELVERFRAPEPPPLRIDPEPPRRAPLPDEQIEREGLRWAWLAMTNTHELHALLKHFRVERRQALRLAGRDLAYPVAVSSCRQVLEQASARALPVMLFVGNRGCIQIHTGPVRRVAIVGDWLNVLDPDFNLHLLEPRLAEVWVVRKPTDQGIVTSLECYDVAGELLLQCFGHRKGNASESMAWRELLEELPADGPLADGAGDEQRVARDLRRREVRSPQAEALPTVGYKRALSAEGILALAPTAVLATDAAGPSEVIEQLASTGVRVELVPDEPTVAGLRQQIATLADLLGRSEAGTALIARIDADLARVTPLAEAPPRVLFLLHFGSGGGRAAGRDTAADTVIRLAGGENVLHEAFSGYKPLSAEATLAAAPDVILMTEGKLEGLGGVDAVLARAGLAATPAGQAGRIVTMDAALLLGFGPRLGTAVTELAGRMRTLHPGESRR